jgi:hypothetical protein
MDNNTGLQHQPDAIPQPPLKGKKKHSSWEVFSILLIIVNLLYLWAFFIFSPFILTMLVHSPLLLPLAIMDYIAVSSYRKKRSPPWKVLFIPLVAVNVIFFSLASWGLGQSGGGVAATAIILIALILLLIDSIAVSSYIYIHHTSS